MRNGNLSKKKNCQGYSKMNIMVVVDEYIEVRRTSKK